MIPPARRAALEAVSNRLVQAPAPNADVNAPAFGQLATLLSDAATRLMALDVDPVIVAASPCRFNDIYISPWRAVRAGDWLSEKHEYETTDLDHDILTAPGTARTAYQVLTELEQARWRTLCEDAMLDKAWNDEALFLVIQNATPWLVIAGSVNEEPNHVFALWDTDFPLVYFGEAVERFDHDMARTPALRFQINGGEPIIA